VQKPHPPIIVGGGSKETLRIAVKFADEWNSTAPYAVVKEKVALLDELCAAAGRERASLRCSKLISLNLTDSKSGAEDIAARLTAQSNLPPGVPRLEAAQEVSLIGGPSEVAEQVARWASLGIDHLHFFTPRPMSRRMLETFAAEVMPQFQ